MSTQREQLWAVDMAARGEGATLQALAATIHSSIQGRKRPSRNSAGSIPLAIRSSTGSWQEGGGVPLDIESFYSMIQAGSWLRITNYHAPHCTIIQGAIGEGWGPILSTQREQLWAVDKAARGEGATLQALAATRRPTQREHL